jgi:glyoxalase family protein
MSAHEDIHGLHHAAAIASGAQASLDSCTAVLGLRLIKRTVNFDAPDPHQFYDDAAAGSLLTFLSFANGAARRVGTP